MIPTTRTRESARRLERNKPHYYLPFNNSRRLIFAGAGNQTRGQRLDLYEFESRIDWSTWGPSR